MLRRVMMAGAAGGGGADPYWGSVSALLHFDGTPASTTFTDEKGNTWTGAGGTAELSSAVAKFGPTSLVLVAGGYLYNTTSGLLDLSTDFTIEFWTYTASDGSGLRCYLHAFNDAGSNNGLNIYRNSSSGVLQIDNALAATTAGSIAIPLNTLTHIAAVRDGGTIRGYVEGVEALSHAAQTYPATITKTQIGAFKGPNYLDHGYKDELRITNGVCRYPSGTTFTPPTAPFPNS